jgi:hypothetical protein
MAFRTWVRLLLATLGVGALAGASQLGVAYGLGIVRLTRVLDPSTRDQWTAQLTWVAWFAMIAAVVGALVGASLLPAAAGGSSSASPVSGSASSFDSGPRSGSSAAGSSAARLSAAGPFAGGFSGAGVSAPAWPPGAAPPRIGTVISLALAAGIGAAVVVPLTMQPARTAQIAGVHPVFVIGICTGLGTLVGVLAAIAALMQPVSRWSLTMVSIATWIIAVVSVAPSLGPDDPLPAVRLGVFDAGYLSPVATQRMALFTMPALALLTGALVGWAARRRGCTTLTIALAGLPGPALLTMAYLIAGPGSGSERYQVVPYWAAMTATGAGVLGSVLAAVVRRGDDTDDGDDPGADRRPFEHRPGEPESAVTTATAPPDRTAGPAGAGLGAGLGGGADPGAGAGSAPGGAGGGAATAGAGGRAASGGAGGRAPSDTGSGSGGLAGSGAGGGAGLGSASSSGKPARTSVFDAIKRLGKGSSSAAGRGMPRQGGAADSADVPRPNDFGATSGPPWSGVTSAHIGSPSRGLTLGDATSSGGAGVSASAGQPATGRGFMPGRWRRSGRKSSAADAFTARSNEWPIRPGSQPGPFSAGRPDPMSGNRSSGLGEPRAGGPTAAADRRPGPLGGPPASLQDSLADSRPGSGGWLDTRPAGPEAAPQGRSGGVALGNYAAQEPRPFDGFARGAAASDAGKPSDRHALHAAEPAPYVPAPATLPLPPEVLQPQGEPTARKAGGRLGRTLRPFGRGRTANTDGVQDGGQAEPASGGHAANRGRSPAGLDHDQLASGRPIAPGAQGKSGAPSRDGRGGEHSTGHDDDHLGRHDRERSASSEVAPTKGRRWGRKGRSNDADPGTVPSPSPVGPVSTDQPDIAARPEGRNTTTPPIGPAHAAPPSPSEQGPVWDDRTPVRGPFAPEPQSISPPLPNPEPVTPPIAAPTPVRPRGSEKRRVAKQSKDADYVDWVSGLGSE